MALMVLKFGGTSVADSQRIRHICSLIARAYDAGNQVVVVLSAQGHTTDHLMAQALERDGVEEILTPCGYDLSRPVEEILAHLGQRVRQGGSFPHEIGLFLGYPVEDVVGFIENQGQNFKLCGPWKVYGDVEAAQQCFTRMQKVSQKIRERMEQGNTLFQVFAVA